MKVGFVSGFARFVNLGNIEIDDNIHLNRVKLQRSDFCGEWTNIEDVKSASQDICGDQDACHGSPELVDDPVPIIEIHLSRNGRHTPTAA